MPAFHLSLFAYKDYIAEVQPLVAAADRGDFAQLRREAIVTARKYEGVSKDAMYEKCPICIHGGFYGGSLETESEIAGVDAPDPQHVGRWFLQILDRFLSNTLSLVRGGTVGTVGRSIGWSEADVDLIYTGMRNGTLLKPDDRTEQPRGFLDDDSPYWHWLRFDGATTGWLNRSQVAQAIALLERDREAILAFDFTRLEGINPDPVVLEQLASRVERQFPAILAQLQLAQATAVGLFASDVYID